MPGADPAAALAVLGDGAAGALAAALLLLPGAASGMSAAGVPFEWGASAAGDIADALVADARAVSAAPRVSPGRFAAILPLPPRAEWMRRVEACLDHAASEADAGRMPDPLDALLVAPGVDLRPALGLADAAARMRFAAWASPFRPASRRWSYLRRSAAEGMMAGIARALLPPPGAARGSDETGWTVWWEVSGADADAAMAAVPAWIAGAAAAPG